MTVAILMQNTLKSAERLWTQSRERRVVPLELNLLEKVPRYVLCPKYSGSTDISLSLVEFQFLCHIDMQ